MSILSIFGLAIYLIGWIWLIVRAGKGFGWLWALIVLLFSMLGGVVFCIVKKDGWLPWSVAVFGWILMAVAASLAR